jgi:hypothetical protein
MPRMFLPVAKASSATVMVNESGRAQCHRRLPVARDQRAAGRTRVDSSFSGWPGHDGSCAHAVGENDVGEGHQPVGGNDSTGGSSERHRCDRAHPCCRQSLDAKRKLLAGPAFPQRHEGGVIVGARSRGADRRREGQRAVGATRGVPTGATNSAIAALLKSRCDRARPCWPTSTTVPTAEFSRQPRIYLVHERGAQLESESQSRYGDRVRRDLWVRLAVGVDERRCHVGLSTTL